MADLHVEPVRNFPLGPGATESVKRIRLELLILELNCKQNKDRHFAAAERKRIAHTILGLSAALLAAIVASSSLAKIATSESLVVPVLSLLVAGITACLGFLKLDQQTSVHYSVGNAYVKLRGDARRLLHSTVSDLIDIRSCTESLEKLTKRYDEINIQAVGAPTSWMDARTARKQNHEKLKRLRQRVDEADSELLDF